MKSILSALADLDRRTPDGLLIQLADLGATDISISCSPRRGNHGHARVTWTHGPFPCDSEGSTLDIALRRALRTARRVSASPGGEQ